VISIGLDELANSSSKSHPLSLLNERALQGIAISPARPRES